MSLINVPDSHRAATVLVEPRGLEVIEKSLPPLEDGHILIKVHAASLNPEDWKGVYGGHGISQSPTRFELDSRRIETVGFPAWAPPKDGTSVGSDFAGVVVKIGGGKGTGLVKVGDSVAGLIWSSSENGSFQEYLVTRPELVWRIPKGTLSYEEAAPMGGGTLTTAVQVLYHRLYLPPPWAPARQPFPVLIWGGSTASGMYAMKLAKMSGLTVATTASPKNHALMKQLGADVVYDYNDPETPGLIKRWSEGKIAHALDAVADQGSTRLCAQAFGDEGGKLITLGPVPEGSGVPNVDAVFTVVLSYLDPNNNKADFALMSEWYRHLPGYASELNIMPLKRWGGGLDGIQSAMEYMKAGNVSAQGAISVLVASISFDTVCASNASEGDM